MADRLSAASGSPEITPAAFLRRMVDVDGQGRLVAFSNKGKASPRNETVSTVEELVDCAMRQSEVQREAYFALAAFDPTSDPKTRKAVDARSLKAFRLDIDTGKEHANSDKGYGDLQEAEEALYAFVDKVGLPDPILVDSGHGVHVYWPLKKAISKEQWLPYAEGLKRLCLAHGLRAGHECTVDVARVLRVPGTTNWKNPNAPEVVSIVEETWDNGPYELDQFASLLNAPVFNKSNGAANSHINGEVPPFVGGARQPSVYEIGYDGPPSKPEAIILGCAHMAHFSETGCGKEGEEPLWKACIGVMAFCENGDIVAHNWSRRDARYDPKQTQDKLDERRKNTSGGSLCTQFAGISPKCKAICEACPHWDKIRSPISLGYAPGYWGAGHSQTNGSGENAIIEPLPLFPPMPDSKPYPVEALGATLSRAAKAISEKMQVPLAMAAQSVLAVASLAASAHADVQLPYGQSRPLSLFLVSVAETGDRKTSADNEALWPVKERTKALREAYEQELKEWNIERAAWAAQKRKIESDRKINLEERKARLFEIGTEPEKPLVPSLTFGDLTVEGLARNWPDMRASLGLFTAEGGTFTAGYGMNDDNRSKTAGTLNELWDGKPFTRVRSTEREITILPGRRLAMHIMIQPKLAVEFLCDENLRNQGFLSRLLVAAPASLAGSRKFQPPTLQAEGAIRAYGARLLRILEKEPTFEPGTRNQLTPRLLTINPEAVEIWREFYDRIERQLASGGNLEEVKDFANKASEHAARIAGVITIIEDLHTKEIGAKAMQWGVELTDWYVREANRLKAAGLTNPKLLRAAKLLEWLHGRPECKAGFREILQFGPNALRTKGAAEEALAILASHGWVYKVSDRPNTVKAVPVARE